MKKKFLINLINKLTSLPLRWREKIKRHYSREVYFDQLLKKLSDNKDINPKIVEQDKAKAEKLRIIFENDEIAVTHQFMSFKNGNEAVLCAWSIKDGKIIRCELAQHQYPHSVLLVVQV